MYYNYKVIFCSSMYATTYIHLFYQQWEHYLYQALMTSDTFGLLFLLQGSVTFNVLLLQPFIKKHNLSCFWKALTEQLQVMVSKFQAYLMKKVLCMTHMDSYKVWYIVYKRTKFRPTVNVGPQRSVKANRVENGAYSPRRCKLYQGVPHFFTFQN